MEDKSIIRFWKRSDGVECVVIKRDNALFIVLERHGEVLIRQAVDSPSEAISIAKQWETPPKES